MVVGWLYKTWKLSMYHIILIFKDIRVLICPQSYYIYILVKLSLSNI